MQCPLSGGDRFRPQTSIRAQAPRGFEQTNGRENMNEEAMKKTYLAVEHISYVICAAIAPTPTGLLASGNTIFFCE